MVNRKPKTIDMLSGDIQLGCYAPHLYPKQWKLLEAVMNHKGSKGVKFIHYVGGRGCAKTSTLCLAMGLLCFVLLPGQCGIFTMPIYRDLEDVFLRTWADIYPQELWTINRTLMRITCVNGSQIDLRARTAGGSRGPNYSWGVFDECAKDFNMMDFLDTIAAIRHPSSDCKVVLTGSTPVFGNDYRDLVFKPGHMLISATSWDNPFLSQEWLNNAEKLYDPTYARQELYGEFIPLEGRFWGSFSNKMYPAGNIMKDVGWQRNKPYYLGVDIGLRGAFQIYQMVDTYCGQRLQSPILCAMAEYTPNNQPVNQVLTRIAAQYGTPAKIFVGADANTSSIQTGTTTMYLFRQRWGNMVPVMWPTKEMTDKILQHVVASGKVLNNLGERKFCIAEKFINHDKENKRGMKEMFDSMQWPGKARDGMWLEKNKEKNIYIDSCDAFLYTMIGLFPPNMLKSGSWAA